MGIVADGGGGDSEEDSGPTPFAVVVEVQDDRGGEIVGSLLRENNLLAAAEGVDGIDWRFSKEESLGGDLVVLGVAVE